MTPYDISEEILQISTQIYDSTIAVADILESNAEQRDFEAINHYASQIETLTKKLVSKSDPEIQTALSLISKRCISQNEYMIWGGIYNSISSYGQRADVMGRHCQLCLIPVSVAVNAELSNVSMILNKNQKAAIEDSLHSHGLIHSHVKAFVSSDLIADRDLCFSIETIQRIASSLLIPGCNIDSLLPKEWSAHQRMESASSDHWRELLSEVRFIAVWLYNAVDEDYGDITQFWGDGLDELDESLELQSDSWTDYIAQEVLPESLDAVVMMMEPMQNAVYSAVQLQNNMSLESMLDEHDIDGESLVCSAVPSIDDQMSSSGFALHFFKRSDSQRIDVLPFNRVANQFLDIETFESMSIMLHHYGIELVEGDDLLPANKLS